MARSGSWRANPQRSWRHFDQAFNNVAPDDLCRSLRFRHRNRRNGASRGLKHSAPGGVVAPPHAFGAIRIEPGNLCLRKTAWWGWEDSNFQPNDYQLLASEVPEVSRFATSALSPQTAD